MTKNPRIHIAKGYAIVSPGGKIQLETVGPTKAHPLSMMMDWDRAKGCKIMRVEVVVHMPPKK
jgi:hypothetical protein